MFTEVAEITVKTGQNAEFEASVAKAVPLFLRARGCHGLSLHQVVETPQVYRLLVKWETVENHMLDFRDSEDFQEWRKLTGPFFENPPVVTHSRAVLA